jgi:hypothetical protein
MHFKSKVPAEHAEHAEHAEMKLQIAEGDAQTRFADGGDETSGGACQPLSFFCVIPRILRAGRFHFSEAMQLMGHRLA